MVYSGFEYVENILKCAKDGLQKPEDFGYWGSDDMFKTWGFCGVDKNRDSDLLEISNFEVITRDLISKFPNDFKIENYSHWMVGNVDRLVCRILKYELPFIDQVKEKDITTAFIAAMEWLDILRDYPVADEADYSDKQYEQSIAEIIEWDKCNPGMIYKDNLSVENWSDSICYELQNEGYSYSEDSYYPDEAIYKAIYNIGLKSEEQYSKWVEFCEKYNLDMPASIENEISKNNPDQNELPFVFGINLESE